LVAGGLIVSLLALPSASAPDALVRAAPRPALELAEGVSASAPAVRGEQVRLRPLPRLPVCRRVAVVGDSLMDNARPYLRSALDRAGYSSVIDAQASRRIPESVRAPYSGVTAAFQVRATWGDADCWVIALGSNDLIFGGDDPTIATSMIDSMLAAVTPNSRIWWVNLDYHRDPRVPFDFVRATATFNAALDARAAAREDLAVIDWFSLAESHLDWFFDPVHVDAVGSRARADQVAEALAN
jgi:lysophospholipase L1-like esterase